MRKKPLPKIEKLKKTDLPQLRALVDNISNFKKFEKDCALELIEFALKNKNQRDYIIYTAKINNLMAGFIIYGWIDLTKGCYDLYWIAVDNNFRGKGIGKKLIQSMEKNVKKDKGRSVFIETSSKTNYTPTRIFYEKCGYEKTAVIKDFYDKNDHKMIYRKNIR
ncbi:MAG: GNAT family N-acetyltransferase [Candidatus Aureabacteria bacterium]|nr:GNAT family N-acetyltransferase [Candidatus Auribacterota bacterium]